MISHELREQTEGVLNAYWHYNDEGKAYTPETYIPFMKQYSMISKSYHKAAQDEEIKAALAALFELEKQLVQTGDPSKLKIDLWEAGKVPDMRKNKDLKFTCDDEFQSPSRDPEGYIPGFVPYFIEDGRFRPVILVLAGGHRSNFSCGDQVCRFFNRNGYHAVLMGHRVGIQKLNYCLDLQRAVRHLRYYKNRYRIDPNRIGAIGLSFGGIVVTSYIEKLCYDDKPSRYDSSYEDDEVDGMPGNLNAFLGVYTSSSPYLPRDVNQDYSQYPPSFLVIPGADEMVKFQLSYANDLIRHDVRTELSPKPKP